MTFLIKNSIWRIHILIPHYKRKYQAINLGPNVSFYYGCSTSFRNTYNIIYFGQLLYVVINEILLFEYNTNERSVHSRQRTTCLSSNRYKITETCVPPMTTLNNGFIFTLHVHCSICIVVGIDDFCFERPVIFSTTTRKPSVHLWLEINYLSRNNEINMCFRLNFQQKCTSETVQFGEWIVYEQHVSPSIIKNIQRCLRVGKYICIL